MQRFPKCRTLAYVLRLRLDAVRMRAAAWIAPSASREWNVCDDAILAKLWAEVINPLGEPNSKKPSTLELRLFGLGVERNDLARLAHETSYHAVFETLFVLGEEGALEMPGLFEGLLTADPTGKSGSGLWH